MSAGYLLVTLTALAVNGFSGVSAIARFAPIIPAAMEAAGVPLSWLVFPIGTLKTLGAVGLALGIWFPAVGHCRGRGGW